MSLIEGLRLAVQGLGAYKMRSALTVLGVVIGVAAVVALMSIGQGTEANITSRFESMGTNLLFVDTGSTSQGSVRGGLGSAYTLTVKDAEAIADPINVPSADMVAPEVDTRSQVVAGGKNTRSRIVGVTPEYEQVRNSPVAEGEFITQRHVDGRSMVCVLGDNVSKTLFGEADPVGEWVKMRRYSFRVIGTLQRKGGSGQVYEDDVVLVPLSTAQSRLSRRRTAGGVTVERINVQVLDGEDLEVAKEEIAILLRERHRLVGEDDFTITSQEEVIQARTEVAQVFTIFLGAVAGIALLVGGIGIMNIMLVSVTERTREIGIRKAVGATRRDIMMQFLVEATMLSLGGGLLGVLLGWGTSQIISGMTMGEQPFYTIVSPQIAILAFSVAVLIGLFFGIYPASRAARLNPIEALRYE
jgi:putative ABC transport system permease protein